jgi:hypothetical protein
MVSGMITISKLMRATGLRSDTRLRNQACDWVVMETCLETPACDWLVTLDRRPV